MIIAVDGESASGKGTVSKIIAKKLSLKYLDTGSLYRGLAYRVNQLVDINDHPAVLNLASQLDLDNISKDKLKTDNIAQLAANLAQKVDIRAALNKYQKVFIEKYQTQGVIIDGRDIGTVICPNADFKFYICASLEVRAKRRYKELKTIVFDIDIEKIKASLASRDFKDKNRKFGALKKASDAIEIDTSELTIDQVVDKMLFYIEKKLI